MQPFDKSLFVNGRSRQSGACPTATGPSRRTDLRNGSEGRIGLGITAAVDVCIPIERNRAAIPLYRQNYPGGSRPRYHWWRPAFLGSVRADFAYRAWHAAWRLCGGKRKRLAASRAGRECPGRRIESDGLVAAVVGRGAIRPQSCAGGRGSVASLVARYRSHSQRLGLDCGEPSIDGCVTA